MHRLRHAFQTGRRAGATEHDQLEPGQRLQRRDQTFDIAPHAAGRRRERPAIDTDP
jgi:hypothetical protein